MTTHTVRVVMVIPAADRAAANAALESAGYGPDTFRVELCPSTRNPKDPPATHYACNWQMTPAERAHVEGVLTAAGVWQAVKVHALDHHDPSVALPRTRDVFAFEGLQRVERQL